jgi:hypothetical protein
VGTQSSTAAARRLARTAGPPLAALVAAHLLLSAAALRGGFDPLSAAAWARWDSHQYLSVATRGYFLGPCPDEPSWCGNTGWLPGFPWGIRAVSLLGVPPVAAGVAVALAFELAMLVFVWRRWLREELAAGSLLALLAVAVGVGAVYRHAVFPMSMTAFFAVLQADRIAARRWVQAGAAGAAAAFCYSSGFMLAPVAAGVILLDRAVPLRARLAAAAGVAGATAAGFLAVLAVQRVEVGAWNAFFLVHERYGHVLQNPLSTLWAYLAAPDSGDGVLDAIRVHLVVSLLFVALVVAAAIVAARRGGSSIERWAALLAVLMFVLPFSFGTSMNPVRSASLLSPAAVALRRLPRPAMAAWLVASAWVVFTMAELFFAKTIV